MQKHQPSRRDFHQWSLAALGGALAGSVAGCGGDPPRNETPQGAAVTPGVTATPGATATGAAEEDAFVGAEGMDLKLLLAEKHVCRGLNTCKGKGGCGETKGANECAGQGACATVEHHDCGSVHDCKGQSGCGQTAGVNACKGQGGCAVPVMDSAWEVARARFEELMKAEGKSIGPAPAKQE